VDRRQRQMCIRDSGMTGHSLVPMAAKAAGVEYADLVLWLLSKAGVHS
jgi:D-alanine-D-alanine ligase